MFSVTLQCRYIRRFNFLAHQDSRLEQLIYGLGHNLSQLLTFSLCRVSTINSLTWIRRIINAESVEKNGDVVRSHCQGIIKVGKVLIINLSQKNNTWSSLLTFPSQTNLNNLFKKANNTHFQFFFLYIYCIFIPTIIWKGL